MSITALDEIAIIITLLSAFLATIRGFSREALSLLSWILAAIFTCFFYKPTLICLEQYISNHKLALGITTSTLFLISLTIFSFIAMKIADIIHDQRISTLDRIFGFIFGIARSFLILAVGMLIWNSLVSPAKQPNWISNAKSRPLLNTLSKEVWNMIPREIIQIINEKNVINQIY
ncbi:MAG: membrane protein required for colicin V production [Candidatus Tokpelaia sp. JSC161]|jgi:membrane protein required for colicin V production|nr:MAG: membrane protein required for colicin V production [Candidatus Tokpelaia sp. JSC161]